MHGLTAQLLLGCLCNLGQDKPLTEQHLAGCAHGGHRTERHDRVVKLMSSIATQSGCSRVTVEPRKLRGYGDKRPDLMYRDANMAGKRKTVIIDAAVASTLPAGANHLRKAAEDPLYKAKLTEQRKIKENEHRMTASQRFVPLVFQSTGGFTRTAGNLMRHPGLRRYELPADLRQRLPYHLSTGQDFIRMQMVMRVVKGTAQNMVKLANRICVEAGEIQGAWWTDLD